MCSLDVTPKLKILQTWNLTASQNASHNSPSEVVDLNVRKMTRLLCASVSKTGRALA